MGTIAALAALLILCSSASAGEKTVVIWADADTFLADDQPTTPQGDRTRCDVTHGPIGQSAPQVRRQSLFRFPVDFIPAGSEIIWASFEFVTTFSMSWHVDTGAPLGEPFLQLACSPVAWDENTTWSETGEIEANWVSVSVPMSGRTEFDDEMTRQIVSGWVAGIPNDGIVLSSVPSVDAVDTWSCSSLETGIGGAPVLWVKYREPQGGGGGGPD